MQTIEIRRTLQAAEVVSAQANPAVVPGVNGEPDRVVIALEIVAGPQEPVSGDGTEIATRHVFAVELDMLTGLDIALGHARSAAEQLVEAVLP